METKRGMSAVVTTVIIVALTLIAIGIVWAVINELVSEGSGKINLEDLYLDLKIDSVQFDHDANNVSVKVSRNAGKGNLVGIVFIISTSDSTRTLEVETNLGELEGDTFILDLAEVGLDSEDVEIISVSPIIGDGTTQGTSGGILDTVIITGGSSSSSTSSSTSSSSGSGGDECTIDSDCSEAYICEEGSCVEGCTQNLECGQDGWVSNTQYCQDEDVWQAWITYVCTSGNCLDSTENLLSEDCIGGQLCYNGVCVDEIPECVVDGDCGTDHLVASPYCIVNESWQNKTEYTCVDELCMENLTDELLEDCLSIGEICLAGECYEYIECIKHSDCDPGEMCSNEECVSESVIDVGEVSTSWPPGVGEYFDSADLPTSLVDYTFYHVMFTSGEEGRCLKIAEFMLPETPAPNSYIRLNVTSSDVVAGDGYEIWQTFWNCNNQII